MNVFSSGRILSFLMFMFFISINVAYSTGHSYFFLILLLNSVAIIAQLYTVLRGSSSTNAASWFFLGGSTVTSLSVTPPSAGVVLFFAWLLALLAAADFSQFIFYLRNERYFSSVVTESQMHEMQSLVSQKYRKVALTSMVSFLFSSLLYNFLPVVVLPNPAAGTAVFAGAILILILLVSYDWSPQGRQTTSTATKVTK